MQLPWVIDVEASGFGRGSYPIEIGYVSPNQETYCTLIKPLDSWNHWDPQSESLHGITREILKSRGKTIIEVANWLNIHLSGQIVYSDAWGNDMSWIGRLFDETGIIQAFRLESIVKLLSEEQLKIWTREKNHVLAESVLKRHRASADARINQDTYKRVCTLL